MAKFHKQHNWAKIDSSQDIKGQRFTFVFWKVKKTFLKKRPFFEASQDDQKKMT